MKRRSFASSQSHEFHGINVTPMIDVVMCLIIFFLVVSSLAATVIPAVPPPITTMS